MCDFREPESGDTLLVDAAGMKADYLDAVRELCDNYRRECLLAGIDYVALNTSLPFDKALVALPTYCLALMQNVAYDVQDDLTSDLKELADTDMDEHVKSLNLGLRVVNITGPRLLEIAVISLGDTIRRDADGDDT